MLRSLVNVQCLVTSIYFSELLTHSWLFDHDIGSRISISILPNPYSTRLSSNIQTKDISNSKRPVGINVVALISH